MTITKDLIHNELGTAMAIMESVYVDFNMPVIRNVTISSARSFWGSIKNLGDHFYELKVSNVFNEIPNEKDAKRRLLGMLVHELIHTIDGCMNHGDRWKYFASRVNKMYPYLNVQRCTSMAAYGVSGKEKIYKYRIVCDNCGKSTLRRRKSETTDEEFLNKFCSCAYCNAMGRFKVITL